MLFPVTSKMLLMPRSSLVFSCNFQDSLHATRLTFLHVTSNTLLMLCSSLVISCNFQDALRAALLNLNLSHVASNTVLMLRPQPFLCNFPHALDARLLTFFKEKKFRNFQHTQVGKKHSVYFYWNCDAKRHFPQTLRGI